MRLIFFEVDNFHSQPSLSTRAADSNRRSPDVRRSKRTVTRKEHFFSHFACPVEAGSIHFVYRSCLSLALNVIMPMTLTSCCETLKAGAIQVRVFSRVMWRKESKKRGSPPRQPFSASYSSAARDRTAARACWSYKRVEQQERRNEETAETAVCGHDHGLQLLKGGGEGVEYFKCVRTRE